MYKSLRMLESDTLAFSLSCLLDNFLSLAALPLVQNTQAFLRQTPLQSSACTRVEDIRKADVPMLLMAGWLDATAASAISAYVHAAKKQGATSGLKGCQ